MKENRALLSATKVRSGLYALDGSSGAVLLADGLSGFLARRWRLILMCALVVIACGVVAYNLLPGYYRASTVIALKQLPQRDGLVNLQANEQRTQLEVQAIQSRELAAAVIDQLRLDANPEFNSALRGEGLLAHLSTLISELGRILQTSPVPSNAELAALRRTAVIDAFSARLTVSPLRMTGLIQISFVSEDARTAYTAANTLADTYIASAVAARAEALQKSAAALEERIASLRDELREMPARSGGLAAIERQLEARKTLLQSYISRLGDVLLEKSALDSHAVVQSRAVLPLRTTGLPLSRTLPLLALAGLVLGAAIAIWRETTSKTILSPSQLDALFGLRVLASSRRGRAAEEDARIVGNQLALELLLARPSGRKSVIALISVSAGKLSQSVALEAARGAARGGRRTLFIEASAIRRQAVGVEDSSNTAFQRQDPPSAQEGVPPVRRDETSGLDLLTADLGSRSVAVACEKLRKIVSAMGEAYDLIILHVEGGGTTPEFRFLASLADTAAVIVVEAQTTREELRNALGELALKGLQALGAVVLKPATDQQLWPRPTPRKASARLNVRRLSSVWHRRLDPLLAGLGSGFAEKNGRPDQPSRSRWRRFLLG